ncbi:MAG: PAS domain S-box protein, partial [Sphingomonas sp.]
MRDESGRVAGMFCACTETTSEVLAVRRRDTLLELDQRLADLTDPTALAFTASELLGEMLGVARVGYGMIDAEAGTIAVDRDWTAPGFASAAGVHQFADYGSYIDELRQGRAVASSDIETDPRTSASPDAFRALGVRAFLDVPVVEQGQTTAQFFVHSAVARRWTDEEIGFVRQFAERTRAAIARRRAEQELFAQAKLTRLIFDQMQSGLIIGTLVRDDDGKVVDWRYLEANPTLGDLVGLPSEQTIGRTIRDVFGPSIEDAWVSDFARVMKTREPVTFVRQVGSLGRWYEGHGFYIDEQRFGVSFMEITERRRVEEALIESEVRFRNMADHSPMMTWVTDPDGECTYLNARWYAFTGQPAQAGEGRGWLDAVHPGDRALAAEEFAAANAERRAYRVDFRLRRGDGEYRWVIDAAAPRFGSDGDFLGYVGSLIDIDERREAEERLRESEALSRLRADELISIYDAAPIGLCVFDRDMRFVRINDRLA